MIGFQLIRVTRESKNKYYLSIFWNGRRYRYFNGKPIGSTARPNLLPPKLRHGAFFELKKEYIKAIELGWAPGLNWAYVTAVEKNEARSLLREAILAKCNNGISDSYHRKLKSISNQICDFLQGAPLTSENLSRFIIQNRHSNSYRNNLRRHIMALEKELKPLGYNGSVRSSTPKFPHVETLHKPFKNIHEILDELKDFDSNLHVCCLLTFGCMLRPHREVRLLTWGDFNNDCTLISLSGSMTKGRKNRVLPVPEYVREHVLAIRKNCWTAQTNIFTGDNAPFNRDYFSKKWQLFKKTTSILEKGQTIYSFRHTGAIQVFERTGSLVTIQQLMGHSTLQVSLTYLRGLELKQIGLNDMPILG